MWSLLPFGMVENGGVTAPTTNMVVFVIQIELTTNLEMGGSLVEPMDPLNGQEFDNDAKWITKFIVFFPFIWAQWRIYVA